MYCPYTVVSAVAGKGATVETVCPMCGKVNRLVMDEDQFGDYRIAARNRGEGKHIQDIFPKWTCEDREKLMTGFCTECLGLICNGPMKPEEIEEEEG